MTATPHGFDTKLMHAGETEPRLAGAVSMPVFQSVNYEYELPATHDVCYIRYNNTPNHDVLHRKLAALEGGQDALVTASGMAAISTSWLSMLSAGDHILVQDALYGGTVGFIQDECPAFGVAVDTIDANDPGAWERKLKPNTRAVYVESMTNPLVQVGDLRAIVAFARAHGLISMIDNTFATPVNFRPLEIGFDLSIHSATKYLNGHSDIAAGAIIGSTALIGRIRARLNRLGGCLDPHAAFLLHRGLKTLGVRVRHQNDSAVRIARFLEDHPRVTRVHHPSLENHPHHARARELFDGFGGTLAFEVDGGEPAVDRILAALTIAIRAPSLGGVETLVMPPARISHANLPADERARLGITDSLIRLAVGLETTDDLIADLDQALRA